MDGILDNKYYLFKKMTKEIWLLFIINTLSAVGYSLVAPLYPLIAFERGLKEHIIGLIIALFAISNFLSTPIVPKYISKHGKNNMFYLAMTLEVL
jgi:MFS family permease